MYVTTGFYTFILSNFDSFVFCKCNAVYGNKMHMSPSHAGTRLWEKKSKHDEVYL